ncbi:MAG: PGF-CTERM sorting domain-containing protein [Methanolobus sp.]
MKYKFVFFVVLLVMLAAGSSVVSAKSSYLGSFNSHYNTDGTRLDSCAVCHSGPNGGSINVYGRAYSGNRINIASIEDIDSDGDGFTNIEEIEAFTFPGNSADYPEIPIETVDNTTDVLANTTENSVDESAVEEITENRSSQEEVVEEIPEQESTEETADESPAEQQSPGFEIIIAIAGMLSVAYLRRK